MNVDGVACGGWAAADCVSVGPVTGAADAFAVFSAAFIKVMLWRMPSAMDINTGALFMLVRCTHDQ